MNKIYLLAYAMLISGTVVAQIEKSVDSRITDVTVFLNRAQVTRQIRTRIESGRSTLVLRGLTSQLDQQSIQASAKGDFIILGLEHRQNFLNELNVPNSLRLLMDSVSFLQRQFTLEQSQKEILNKEEQMLLSNQKIGGANQNLSVIELKAMADFYRARLSDIVTSRMKQDEKVLKLDSRIQKLQQQISQQNELYSRNTSEILINIASEISGSADLTVNYLVDNAGWYPVYDLRATNTKSPIQLSYKANVIQNTGEIWNNVKLKLSTSNPSLGGTKPELSSWLLNFNEDMYLRALAGRVAGVQLEKRKLSDHSDKSEDIAPVSAESIAEYTTAIQTTLNTEFNIGLPYTINSSNKPTLVDIKNYEMKAEYIYSVAPKLDQDAFLMARAVGWEDFNLLPGEANVFFEGTFVAKTHIDPNVIQDTLSISLGRDKRIVVKRQKLKDYTSKKLISSNRRENYTYEISVRNTKQDAIKIIIEDQVPVSQNSQIEIIVEEIGGASYRKETGKLSWDITLEPDETTKVIYKFEVKYPKDKIIAGL
jgi:uncharacterized protein (TIGR02231 family)